MKVSIIIFPGSNCDKDVAKAILTITNTKPKMIWHKESNLSKSDLIIIPGGFSYGDYLRSGAIAAPPTVMNAVIDALGGQEITMPATAEKVWKACKSMKKSNAKAA